MAPIGVELETLVFEPDAQTTRPPPCAVDSLRYNKHLIFFTRTKLCN